MLNNFKIVKSLGEGSFGSVYLVRRHSDDQLYALKKVKMLNLNDKDKQNALNEIRLLASVNHPNIIEYKESFIDPGSQSLCMVMEYADGGDLNQKIAEHSKRKTDFAVDEILSILAQAILGLKALHDARICHRDLKCANIFLTRSGQVKLGDFNVSKVIQRGMLHTQTGTPYYASPEVWQDQPYDQKCDIWSLGCVLYEMIAKRPPFKSTSMSELYKKVIAAKYPPLSTSQYQVPFEFIGLLKMILQPNPRLRPSCNTLLKQEIIQQCLNRSPIANQQYQMEDKVSLVAASENPKRANRLHYTTQQELLNTIKLTPKLSQLNNKLPKSNYENDLTILDDSSSGGPRFHHHRSQTSVKVPKIQKQNSNKELPSVERRLQQRAPSIHIGQSPNNQKMKRGTSNLMNIEESVMSLHKYIPSDNNIQQVQLKTPRPLALKQLDLQNQGQFYPSPYIAASSSRKRLQVVPSSDQIDRRQDSSQNLELFEQSQQDHAEQRNSQILPQLQKKMVLRKKSDAYERVNLKLKSKMDLILEERIDSELREKYESHHHMSEAKARPRYKSVVRKDLQNSSMSPAGNVSARDLQSHHRTLQRKNVTNDLYSRIGSQIAQTPRNKNEGGLIKLPSIDMKHHGSIIQTSILEESLAELQISHEASSPMRRSDKGEHRGGRVETHPDEYFYYDFITSSSVDIYESQRELQTKGLTNNSVVDEMNCGQDQFSSPRKRQSNMQALPRSKFECQGTLLSPLNLNKIQQGSATKSRQNLNQRTDRRSLLAQ